MTKHFVCQSSLPDQPRSSPVMSEGFCVSLSSATELPSGLSGCHNQDIDTNNYAAVNKPTSEEQRAQELQGAHFFNLETPFLPIS